MSISSDPIATPVSDPLTGSQTMGALDRGAFRQEHRSLTRAEAILLHRELKTTPNILGYTVGELLSFTDVLIMLTRQDLPGGEQLAGVCICKDLLFGWTDIAVLYVLPEYRGRGLSSLLFHTAIQSAESRQRHIYTLSRTPPVIHLMKQVGMELTRAVWKAPLAVHLEMNRHMLSWYRTMESFRKLPMRVSDGNRFVSGIKRFRK